MRTIVAEHAELRAEALIRRIEALGGSRGDAGHTREMIAGCMRAVLPQGIEWDGDAGTLYYDGTPGMGPAVQWSQPAELADAVARAVSTEQPPGGVTSGSAGNPFG